MRIGIMGNAAFMLYLSLLATRTLGLSRADFGLTLFIGPIVAFLVSFPAGLLVDRLGPKPVMATGFLMFAANSAAMAFWVHDFRSLMLLLSIYAVANNLVQLPLTSMIFQYAAPAERGNPPRGGSSTKRRAAVRILEEVAGVLLKRPRR